MQVGVQLQLHMVLVIVSASCLLDLIDIMTKTLCYAKLKNA